MELDNRLKQSTEFVTNLPLCEVRLSKNSAFPWLLLIPKLDNVVEIIDLCSQSQHTLMGEIALISRVIKDLFAPDKINIATLGNIVPQLHIHIIARFKTDPAWPNPVWNTVSTEYSISELEQRIRQIKEEIQSRFPEEQIQGLLRD